MAASETTPTPVRWSRIFAGLLALFLFAEATSQAYFISWTGHAYSSVFPYLWSPYGLVRNNPGLIGNYTINPNGFREVRSYQKKKPANTFRVMLLGGSVLSTGHGGPAVLEEEGYVQSDSTISQFLAERLRADPAFQGVNVEVINAGIPFNRIVEVSGAYLEQYINWSPNVVIVAGSANNFFYPVTGGQMDNLTSILQAAHPWRLEFERLVNENSVAGITEVIFRRLTDTFASVAVFYKGMDRLTGRAFDYADRFAVPRPQRPPDPPATPDEERRYFALYTAYADAIIAAAHALDQEVAFYWEYFLGDMKGLKPLSPGEERIYPPVHGIRTPEETEFHFRTRDRWKAYFSERNIPAVDPLDSLKTYSGTVFIDYLHYTKNGNNFIAGVLYSQLHDVFLRALTKSKAQQAKDAPASAQAR